jgi:hypothetical protein
MVTRSPNLAVQRTPAREVFAYGGLLSSDRLNRWRARTGQNPGGDQQFGGVDPGVDRLTEGHPREVPELQKIGDGGVAVRQAVEGFV